MMYDKLIHKNEFRLRILLTNECNKECVFCLNDFQPKEPIAYANTSDIMDCLRAYGSFMKDKSIVTFSGGEPGIHTDLRYMLKSAKLHCEIVKVVTNGTALRPDLVEFVNEWHIGVTHKNREIRCFLQNSKNIMVQIVVTDNMTVASLADLVLFYRKDEIPIKLFVDFNSINKPQLESKIENVINMFGNGVCTRFTGRQTNRGKACSGCKKECVTLKALWVFPDGSATTCPQGVAEYFDRNSGWDEIVKKAYNTHRERDTAQGGVGYENTNKTLAS